MKEKLSFTVFLVCILLIQTSCSTKNNDLKNNDLEEVIEVNLVEKEVGESGYTIFIPDDYSISQSKGPDFSVFYFSPIDTTVTNKLSGGFYFGNFPGKFLPDNDSCKTEILSGKILDTIQEWTVYNCNGDFLIQTIVETKDTRWARKIHVFANTKRRADLKTILEIYATLKKEQ